MRVAFVLPGLDFGGAERMVEELARVVATRGEALVLATTRGGPLAERLQGAGIPVEVMGLASPIDARVPLRLRRRLQAFGPTLVHSHLAVADIAVALAGVGPHWTTLHNAGAELGPLKRSLWRWALGRTQRRFAVAERIRQRWGPAELIHPSFVRPSSPVDAASRAEHQRRLGLEPGPLVLSLGRRSAVKGVDVMVAASLRLPSSVRWLHFGPGPAPSPPGRIEWRRPRQAVGELLAAADVFVQASRSEGFPQATLEAMWTPIPVVVTPVGGTRELVGADGLYVPPEAPDALAAAVLRVLRHPTLAMARAHRGRQRLGDQNLTLDGMLGAYLEHYGRG